MTDPDLGPVVAYDAAQDPDACRVMVRSLLSGRRLRSPDTEVRFESPLSAVRAEDVLTDSRSLEPRVYTGQQSNTSVMLGDVAMIKLFRRLELGRNLDIEVHAALNAAQVDDVARLYGWIEGGWVSERPASRHRPRRWWWRSSPTPRTAGGSPWTGCGSRQSFADDAAGPGSGSGRDPRGAARGVSPPLGCSGRAAASVMTDRLAGRSRDRAGPADLRRRPGGLFRRARRAEILDTQRVHGDFHLGQTLHTPGGLEDHRLRG